jgi:hypothetical protein
MKPRACHDHGLSLAVYGVLRFIREVFNHDFHFVADRMRVELDKRFEEVGCFRSIILRIVGDRLLQSPISFVRCVVFQHVKDKFLFDCLTHAIETERLELSIGPLTAGTTPGSELWVWP